MSLAGHVPVNRIQIIRIGRFSGERELDGPILAIFGLSIGSVWNFKPH